MRLLALCSLLLIWSCNESEETGIQRPDRQMNFSAEGDIRESKTRGGSVTETNLNTMAVYGYYSAASPLGTDAPDFAYLFDKEKLTRNASGNWTYAPPKYWVPQGYHHFFAFAPYEDLPLITHVRGNHPVMHLDVPSRARDQKDLLWSLGTTVNRVYQESGSNQIHFNLKHALTQVRFSGAVAADYKGETVCIEKIVLKNLYRSASSYCLYRGMELTSAGWHTDALSGEDFYASSATDGGVAELKNNYWLTAGMQSLLNDKESFYLMPQSFSDRPDGSVPQLEIHFRGRVDQVLRVFHTTLYAPVDGSGRSGWNPGQSLHYQLTYRGGGDTPFNLQAVVVPWDTQDVEISVPATYLQVASTNMSWQSGKEQRIYFSTNGSSVSQSCSPYIASSLVFDAVAHKGYVIIPAQTPAGYYRLTIRSGNISRIIHLNVK